MAKYLKPDSKQGFVEDYAEIQALKFNNVRHTILGGMLGDFDDYGHYIVDPEIVKELIEMPKYVVEVMDNLEICLSVIKLDKQISFLIAFEGNRATLSLIEKVNFEANYKLDSGTWSNVNEYVLDSVETSGEINRQALYMRWNIQEFGGNIIDIFNCDDGVLAKYFGIVNRFKYNMEASATLLKKEEELEEVEAEYFLDLFEILEEYPELKKAVEKQIKQTLTEKKDFLKLDKPNFTKTLNEVVEKAVEDNLQILPEQEQENFVEDKRNITVKANIKKYEVLPIKTEKVENVVKQEQQTEVVDDVEKEEVKKETKEVVVTKLETEDVKYKTINSIAQELAKTQKQKETKIRENAIEIIIGKRKQTTVEKVVDAIVKTGVAVTTIVTAPVIDAFAGVKAAEKTVEKAVDDAQKAIEKASEPEKKKEVKKETKSAKKEEKKKDNKKDKEVKKEKSTTKETKKEESKVTASGFVATRKNTNSNDIETPSTPKKTRSKRLISQLVGETTKRTNLKVDPNILRAESEKKVDAENNANNNININMRETNKTAIKKITVREERTVKVITDVLGQ